MRADEGNGAMKGMNRAVLTPPTVVLAFVLCGGLIFELLRMFF
jgi:hypothetical protein